MMQKPPELALLWDKNLEKSPACLKNFLINNITDAYYPSYVGILDLEFNAKIEDINHKVYVVFSSKEDMARFILKWG